VEDTDQSQECGKLPWIHEFLLMIYPKLQLHCKTTEQTKGQEELEMGGRVSKGVQETQGKDNKSASIITTQKRRKIQSGNKCVWTCYRKSTIPGTGWEVETNSIFIKDNATSRETTRSTIKSY